MIIIEGDQDNYETTHQHRQGHPKLRPIKLGWD